VTLGSGGAQTNELTYETANSVVRPNPVAPRGRRDVAAGNYPPTLQKERLAQRAMLHLLECLLARPLGKGHPYRTSYSLEQPGSPVLNFDSEAGSVAEV